MSWVKIFNVDLAELKIGVVGISVVISEGSDWYVDVVLIGFVQEVYLESEVPDISERAAGSVRDTKTVLNAVQHFSAAIKLALGQDFHQVRKCIPSGSWKTKTSKCWSKHSWGWGAVESLKVLRLRRKNARSGWVGYQTKA